MEHIYALHNEFIELPLNVAFKGKQKVYLVQRDQIYWGRTDECWVKRKKEGNLRNN